ncbi:DUF4124 domain-containing protein [Pseudomonas sp. ATCC 13867]|uniref:DUF4124 domain-containing protein n=1 Tax=Pseudomonas sp. ATCC 13867 TaxID=1294143 RepID=UPI0005A29284|nr:DUF4124 domain-containing protein [Pseudomonas sp. ATCC 13867]RFQ20040.1 outer membrane protein assembly factor BamE [Pseudomonas sp. ATCC 13867]
MRLPVTLFSILLLLPTAEAAAVFRCTAADGSVLFSQYGCPGDRLQSNQEASNPTPGGDKPAPLANPMPTPRTRPVAREKGQENDKAIVVVGEQQNGCGNRVTGSARRKAIIEGRIRSGMTRGDVESTLGRPDKVSQNNGTLRYHYKADRQHGVRTVTFDEDGCVAGKAKR